MKNCARYIICAISLALTLSLIFDAFADDDHYRKRHRYRGGSQKNDDDNDDHDRDNYFKPVINQTYREACGECHLAYQPELMPSGSWQKILNQLDDHFGEEIEISNSNRAKIVLRDKEIVIGLPHHGHDALRLPVDRERQDRRADQRQQVGDQRRHRWMRLAAHHGIGVGSGGGSWGGVGIGIGRIAASSVESIARPPAGTFNKARRQAFRIVEKDLEDMLRRELLMSGSQCSGLRGLNESASPVGIGFKVHCLCS